jgi:hypothetical protein
VVVVSPLLSGLFNYLLIRYTGFHIGYTILLLNGIITFAGLWLIRKNNYY